MTTPRYALLIPVKDGSGAKSRLGVGSAAVRARLMAAFARDAITAAAACDLVSVHVVGDAGGLTELLAGVDCQIVPDEGEGDLNRALVRAAARVAAPGAGIAVMLADLPCLRTDDVRSLFASAVGRCFVPDASGTGTTFLLAPAGTELDPHFGVGSAQAHAGTGAAAVALDHVSLRLDVDTTEDLTAALQFGVGARTAEVAASLT
ncbi:2-phospho-L-lactate guanylyltransferase [Marmoricola sp. OAE513]|uniref:2-phospho-L-lactate guanylyltransferase n=1 Tax=Marmoricola sp. OAE513 TaxID=2817894 RepID=UPI001AE2D8D5